MPDRNLISSLEIDVLGIAEGTGPSFDTLGDDPNVTVVGAGGAVLGVLIAKAVMESGDDLTLQESDNDSTGFTNVRTDDLTWKPIGATRTKGQYEQGTNPNFELDKVYGTASSGNYKTVLVQYNGTKQYIRLNTSGLTGVEVVANFAVSRRKRRNDSYSSV